MRLAFGPPSLEPEGGRRQEGRAGGRGFRGAYHGKRWVFGLLLIHSQGFVSLALFWMQVKFGLVTILTAYHFYLLICLKDFQFNNNNKSSKFFRIMNEVPTVLLIIIIFVVVFKPL